MLFFSRYRAKNRKTNVRNKEHRMENQSPTEKLYAQEDYYPLPNTTTVSPVPISTVVSIPRMNYDVPYNPNYPPNAAPYPTPQPIYSTTSATYPDIYNTSSHNMVLMNGGQQQFTAQSDFANPTSPNNQNVDMNKRVNWEMVSVNI